MRILFTTQPSHGHLLPLLPLAHALVRAGHTVNFAAAASYCPEVVAHGIPCVPAGLDWYGSQRRDAHFPEFPTLPPGPVQAEFVGRRIFRGEAARRMVPDLLAIARAWRPDVIVRDAAEYGACLAAEVLSLPHVSVRTGSLASAYARRREMAMDLAVWRAEAGLAPDPDGTTLFRYLHLASMPPRFETIGGEIAPTMRFLRPDSQAQTTAPVPPFPGSPGRPVIYLTLGTVVSNQTWRFRTLIDALRGEALNLVVTTGPRSDPADLGPQPPHVRIERYIPQAALLPHCELVVTHGGSGTVLGALGAGRPLVVVPVTADQPENARRCAALGVGRVIEPDDLTPERVRAAVRAVLRDPAYRKRAERLRDDMTRLPPIDRAVTWLERLAGDPNRPLDTVGAS